MRKLASKKLLNLGIKCARLSNLNGLAQLAFHEQLAKEFPHAVCEDDNIAENFAYGQFEESERTQERLTDIINGDY